MSYVGRYERFIDSLRDQVIDGPVEMHHILPKSLGGTNDKSNLIALSPRQHYLAHWMLWKIYGGKMTHAFFLMNNRKTQKKMYGRGYERVRKEYVERVSGENSPVYGKKITAAKKEVLSALRKKYMSNPAAKENLRQKRLLQTIPREAYEKQSKVMSSLVWLNDGVRSYRVKPEYVDEKLACGLVRGRLMNHVDDNFRQGRSQIISAQWKKVKESGHTGNLIRA